MSTRSDRSAGTQITQKGVVQGVVLVDPKTGQPLSVIYEGGQYKLVVKGDGSGGGGPSTDVNIISSVPIAIKDPVSGNILKINADGTINSNVEIDAADGDNIMIVGTEDGTFGGVQHPAKIDANKNLAVKDADAITKLQSIADNTDQIETKLDSIFTELSQKTEPLDSQNIRTISSATDSISVPGVATSNNQTTTNTKLDSLLTELQNKADVTETQPVSVSSLPLPTGAATEAKQNNQITELQAIKAAVQDKNVDLDAFSATPDNVMTVGTVDGSKTGTKYGIVNNLRQQILASHDRSEVYTYADFGTKNERITKIEYTSPTFSGHILNKILTYSLVGVNYKLDNVTWVLT